MPVITGPVPAGNYQESIARVELFTDASLSPDDWRVVIHFENGPYDAEGNLIGPTTFGSKRVERRFADIKDDAEVLALVGLIKKKGYAYRQADIDAKAASK